VLEIAFVAGGVIALIIGAVITIGLLLPVGHVASGQATLSAAPVQVFAVITDVGRYASWRSDVKSVDIVSRAPLRWVEHGRNGNITFEQLEADSPHRIVGKIADAGLPFGGTWTYDLAPSGTGTRVTITERGEVYNPVFRFMSRFVFGHTATINRFLEDLRRLDRTVQLRIAD
jgi:hypothetical protein